MCGHASGKKFSKDQISMSRIAPLAYVAVMAHVWLVAFAFHAVADGTKLCDHRTLLQDLQRQNLGEDI
jgi:hypothetical protein